MSGPTPAEAAGLQQRLPRGVEELDYNPHFYFYLLFLVPTALHGGGTLL